MRVRVKLVYETLEHVAKAASRYRVLRGKQAREDVRPVSPAEAEAMVDALLRLSAVVGSLQDENNPLLREVARELSSELYRRASRVGDVSRVGVLFDEFVGGGSR